MKAELILRFKASEHMLTTHDRTKLQVFWLPSTENRELMNDAEERLDVNIDPTIVFCNPNAGFAESIYYQSEFIEYYVENGMNVVIWNYRGYSKSEGTPSPKNIKKDAELVLQFARDRSREAKVGVHG